MRHRTPPEPKFPINFLTFYGMNIPELEFSHTDDSPRSPQYITQRFTSEEISPLVEQLRSRIVELEAENQRLRRTEQEPLPERELHHGS